MNYNAKRASQPLYEPLIEVSYSTMSKRQYSMGSGLSERDRISLEGVSSGFNDVTHSSQLNSQLRSAMWLVFSHWKNILQVLTMVYVMCACTILLFWNGDSPFSLHARSESSGTWVGVPHRRSEGDGLSVGSLTVEPVDPAKLAAINRAKLPKGFDWEAYLWWNADVKAAGYDTKELAEGHYLANGAAEKRLHKRARISLRYTACGGLFNQHYCHLSAVTLAVVAGFQEVYWPPMQERASFAKRFSKDPRENVQTWQYVDATTLWDIPRITEEMQKQFNLTVTKHADNCKMPNFTQPLTAYQECPLLHDYDLHFKFDRDMYIKHIEPETLREMVLASVRDAHVLKGGRDEPQNILIDMPCTLFMMELRHLEVTEDVARTFAWAPAMQELADKVIRRIREEANATLFNGIHLRMEKDAADWAANTGGPEHYWDSYKQVMGQARFDVEPKVLYVASGLLKSSVEDEWSRLEMERLSREMVDRRFATAIVHKEMYLSPSDLASVLNEQSALIDFLVLRQAWSVVGVGMSTFSFYLKEDRLMDGRDPRDMSMLTMPSIGTDELFYSAAVVAIKTRKRLAAQNRLNEVCQRATLEPCFS